MSVNLEISLAPKRLNEGSPEECAAFGLFKVCTAETSLTEGFDYYLTGYRPGPLVSGYHMAEWLAWNWWRLRWEPRAKNPDGAFTHQMASIGEGYIWPNITVFSDGIRTALLSKPSERPDAKPFRYVGAQPLVIPSTQWEGAVDAFISQVLGQLDAEKINTNLHVIWAEVVAERSDPEISEFRRIEAMFSRDPDSVKDRAIERLLADSDRLGKATLGEIAANKAMEGTSQGMPLTAAEFEKLAQDLGHDASTRDSVKFAENTVLQRGAQVPAWRLGVAAARKLRKQEHLGDAPINDVLLAEMAGTRTETLTGQTKTGANLSFILEEEATKARLVLRSKWHTGRRFDLTRLIGDSLIGELGALHPATATYTYRQKAQRGFAAELLCPFDVADKMLAGNYDDKERRHGVASHFEVSPWTIETLLMNHGRLDRDDPEHGFNLAVA